MRVPSPRGSGKGSHVLGSGLTGPSLITGWQVEARIGRMQRRRGSGGGEGLPSEHWRNTWAASSVPGHHPCFRVRIKTRAGERMELPGAPASEGEQQNQK